MARVIRHKSLFTALTVGWFAILIFSELVMTYMVGIDPLHSTDIIVVEMTFIALVFDIVYFYALRNVRKDRRDISN